MLSIAIEALIFKTKLQYHLSNLFINIITNCGNVKIFTFKQLENVLTNVDSIVNVIV
jgi:hypothetical protein